MNLERQYIFSINKKSVLNISIIKNNRVGLFIKKQLFKLNPKNLFVIF